MNWNSIDYSARKTGNERPTVAQLNYLHSLYKYDEMKAILTKMGLLTVNDLTKWQAADLIGRKKDEQID
jgi:hypothetical protein